MRPVPTPARRAMPLLLAVLAGCSGLLDPEEPGNLVPATVDEDPSLPAVELAGTRLHLETRGDPSGPAIVFLHGGPGGDHRSQLVLAGTYDGYSLGDDHLLVFWDQRGAGLSRRHGKESLTIERYLADLEELVDRFSPGEPVLLIGESWGGMYATEFINRHPERVRGAVLLEPGPLSHVFFDMIKDDLHDMDLGSEWLNDWVWSQEILSPDDHARMDYQRCLGIRDSQPRFHQQKDPASPFWRLGAAANRYIEEDGQDDDGNAVYDFTTGLQAYDTEVLLLASGLNEIIGRDFQARQAAVYPNARLEIVEGCGHDFAWVKPAETVGLIRQYIERLGRSAGGGS
jgi:proline iminopeptidase